MSKATQDRMPKFYTFFPPPPSAWLRLSSMFSRNIANIVLRGERAAVSARCPHSSTSICNQQLLLARERHCPPCWNTGTWRPEQVPVPRGGCGMRRFLPAFARAGFFLWQMGVGCSIHYLIAAYSWQSHNLLFHRGEEPFVGFGRVSGKPLSGVFSSARRLCKRKVGCPTRSLGLELQKVLVGVGFGFMESQAGLG